MQIPSLASFVGSYPDYQEARRWTPGFQYTAFAAASIRPSSDHGTYYWGTDQSLCPTLLLMEEFMRHRGSRMYG